MLDLLIINGHVIDPANGVDEVRPVAVYNGKIAHYEEGEPARQVIDAAGRYVFPGLIDSHAHMFAEGTDIGIYPDLAYLPTGVTSAVDATAGVSNYRMFRKSVIEQSKVTIKSFLQVCSAGLATTSYHENINPKYFNPEKMARIYDENRDNILGLKIRQSEELAEGLGIEPLKATVAIAEKIGRKKSILIGITLLLVCFLAAMFLVRGSFTPLLYVIFVLVGVGWAAISVNSLPMVVEMCKGSDVGKFTGYYYTFSMAAQVVTPIASGWLMNHISYETLFPYSAFFCVMALITMQFVKHGDNRVRGKKGLEAFDTDM